MITQEPIEEWITQARIYSQTDPELALKLLREIKLQYPNYEGVDELEKQVILILFNKTVDFIINFIDNILMEQLNYWFNEANQLINTNPLEALLWIQWISNYEPNYPGLNEIKNIASAKVNDWLREYDLD